MSRLRAHMTYANLLATLALVFALGGTGYAAGTMIGAKQLRSGAVTSAKLRDGAVTASKIRPGALRTTHFGPGVLPHLQGPAGTKGDAGPAGAQGAAATTGDAGPAGAQGAAGDRGDAGPAGPQGPTGTTGDAGPAKPQGPVGDRGDTGPAGAQGPAGADGTARAHAVIDPGTPSLVAGRTHGITGVSRPLTGVYCLARAAEIDADASFAMASPEVTLSGPSLETEIILLAYAAAGAPNCPAGQFEVRTYAKTLAALSDAVAFAVIVP